MMKYKMLSLIVILLVLIMSSNVFAYDEGTVTLKKIEITRNNFPELGIKVNSGYEDYKPVDEATSTWFEGSTPVSGAYEIYVYGIDQYGNCFKGLKNRPVVLQEGDNIINYSLDYWFFFENYYYDVYVTLNLATIE